MDRPLANTATDMTAPATQSSAALLDLRHLNHQTLNDAKLRRIVLELFLDEAPQYAANLRTAQDRKAWRMAVHTLKGVALNLGAFPLAWLCKDTEALDLAAGSPAHQTAALALAALIEDTATSIRMTLGA